MENPQPGRLTYQEFLDYTSDREGLFEFVDGHILDMGIPSDVHQDIQLFLGIALSTHLTGKPCKVRLSGRLWTGTRNRGPDLLVACAKRTDPAVTEIRLIIEILSPNRGDDTTLKLLEYQRIPSIEEYVLIDSTRRWASRYRRDPQGFFICDRDYIGGSVAIQSIEYILDLDGLYQAVGVA